ncbi:sodium-dependent transporter [Desulfosediminicola flagellatus]|uniref:sodium-dependent transporter n=1 Tax=Desulfosediminicola flagellatus TaxID=2569541 RepID=UPI0010AC20AE|nr:sodium-dependent transporter [Desulfosediminicola flagellatus]
MRNHWSSRFGFILAAVGSAVGLGNIWKFPFITGMNGGGAFVLVYLVAILCCGLPILMAEFLIGRHSQKDVVGSFRELTPHSKFWKSIGWLNLAAAFIILSYYGVVAGWTLDYLFKSLTGAFAGQEPEAISGMFGALVTDPTRQMVCLTAFMSLCLIAVISGIKEGIERWNKILMPTLFGILFFMAAYAMTTSGAKEGLKFMLYPDFSKLTINGVLEAIGHSFFTLSLAMGAMITYASYMDKKEAIYPVSIRIAFLDTLVAIVAGLAIFPIVFSVGMEPGSGPGLIFKTLPQVFATIPMGAVLSTLFFLLLAFAALSSAISLLEVLTAFMIDEKKFDRKKATICMTIAVYIAGIPSALSYSTLGNFKLIKGMEVLDSLDYVASNFMLPIGGLLIAIYSGYILDKRIAQAEITEDGTGFLTIFNIWYFTIRYIAPVAVLIVFLTKIGIIKL